MCCCFGMCNLPVKSRRVSSPFATPTVILVGSKCLHFEAQDTPPTAHQSSPSHFLHLGHPILIVWPKTALHLDNPSYLCLYICPLPQICAPKQGNPSSPSIFFYHLQPPRRSFAGEPPPRRKRPPLTSQPFLTIPAAGRHCSRRIRHLPGASLFLRFLGGSEVRRNGIGEIALRNYPTPGFPRRNQQHLNGRV